MTYGQTVGLTHDTPLIGNTSRVAMGIVWPGDQRRDLDRIRWRVLRYGAGRKDVSMERSPRGHALINCTVLRRESHPERTVCTGADAASAHLFFGSLEMGTQFRIEAQA